MHLEEFQCCTWLGHLLLDDFYDIEGMSKVEYKEMEDTMNRFAGALLVPEEVYRNWFTDKCKNRKFNFFIFKWKKKIWRISCSTNSKSETIRRDYNKSVSISDETVVTKKATEPVNRMIKKPNKCSQDT